MLKWCQRERSARAVRWGGAREREHRRSLPEVSAGTQEVHPAADVTTEEAKAVDVPKGKMKK
eukprot:2975076-Alexandrium_andersonii.AAC.1